MTQELRETLEKIREKKPLILNYTNYVSLDVMANVLLSLGASPIMSFGEEEVEDLVGICDAINVNIGTCNEAANRLARKVIECARRMNKPVVLDPVGAGASQLRTQLSRELLLGVDIVRGNASEISAICGLKANNASKGVDASDRVEDVMESARAFALNLARPTTLVISGPIDFITDGKRQLTLPYGSSTMPLVTALGCSLTSVIAAFRAVVSDSYKAAELATAFYGLCGEACGEKNYGPGSFRTNFLDFIHQPDWNQIETIVSKHRDEENQ